MNHQINKKELMKYFTKYILIFCLALLSISCSTQDKENTDQDKKLLITQTSFRGISVGDKITSLGNFIEKDQLKTGEGDFAIYRIKDFHNKPAGYFLPDPNDDSLVGDIIIETSLAETKEGIRVGNTFGVLKQKLTPLEVHGSEIEGRTYANHNGLSYRLNIAMFSYQINIKKIPTSTKILEIIINRKPVPQTAPDK